MSRSPQTINRRSAGRYASRPCCVGSGSGYSSVSRSCSCVFFASSSVTKCSAQCWIVNLETYLIGCVYVHACVLCTSRILHGHMAILWLWSCTSFRGRKGSMYTMLDVVCHNTMCVTRLCGYELCHKRQLGVVAMRCVTQEAAHNTARSTHSL